MEMAREKEGGVGGGIGFHQRVVFQRKRVLSPQQRRKSKVSEETSFKF